MGTEDDLQSAEQRLFDTGTLVPFRILDTHTEVAPDRENLFVRVDLLVEDDEQDVEPAEIVEWGAFGFLFALAALSFHDARPRGMSELDFEAHDVLTAADFLDALSFSHNGLSIHIDYLRGRSLKTEATVRPDGTVRLTTWGRGKSALHWLDRLQGKKRIAVVATGPMTS
jgi:hypothetical protein